MGETYVESRIGGNVIFRLDPASGYGFFHDNATRNLYLCPPTLTTLVSHELRVKPGVALLRQLLKKLAGSEYRRPPLREISLYVTERCNLSCVHCWIGARQTGREINVPLNQLLSVIEQAIPLGLSRIAITGGEPITWSGLPRLIEALSICGLGIHIDTNGTLLDRDMAARFADLNVNVSLSLDSHLEALHDRLRGVPGAFGGARRALDLLNEFCVHYELNTCVYTENYLSLEQFFQWCREVGVKAVKLNPIVAWGRGSSLHKDRKLLGSEELVRLANLVRETSDICIRPSLPPCLFPLEFLYHRPSIGICNPKSILSIQPDGHLSVCGPAYRQSRVSLGRIADDLDLRRLWATHPFLLEIRRELPHNMTGICGECVFSKCCSGFCRVLTYDMSHSWLAPYPLCQELYDTETFPEVYRHGHSTQRRIRAYMSHSVASQN